MNTGLTGLLEEIDYRSVEKVFPFLAGWVSRWNAHDRIALVLEVHATYSSIVNELTVDHYDTGQKQKKYQDMRPRTWEFSRNVVSIFEGFCRTGLHILKVHLLDHIATDLEWFESLKVLYASSFERYNVNIMKAYLEASSWSTTSMVETVTQTSRGIAEHGGRDVINPKVAKTVWDGEAPSR